ncbi:hypothetical protein Gohar_008966 [Gossypium harknessii]|uniref:Uncharacterized protein n=1 Tax=Gossypium harknessii TaxID=34285 RepID=A0A7J9GLC8_9ROSI|nr:hypothetical protein [Gossypium harknessii]
MALTASSEELFGSCKHYLKSASSAGEWGMTSCLPMRKYPPFVESLRVNALDVVLVVRLLSMH